MVIYPVIDRLRFQLFSGVRATAGFYTVQALYQIAELTSAIWDIHETNLSFHS